MNLVLIVLLIATLFFAAAFADAAFNLVRRLALVAGIALVLRNPSVVMLRALQNAKLAFFRMMPRRRWLILYGLYSLTCSLFWGYAAYLTARVTILLGLSTYCALMAD